MTTQVDITIYNKKLDENSRRDLYYPTVITGVSYHENVGATGSPDNRSESSEYALRIPYNAYTSGKTYVEAAAYAGLEDVSGYWTIQEDDIIRIGQYTMAETDPADLVGLEYLMVGNHANNTIKGSNFTKHWRISCGKEWGHGS